MLLLLALAALAGLAAGQALDGPATWTSRQLLAKPGDSYSNPINLGSPATLFISGNSATFKDSVLGGCHDEGDYPDFNATAGTNGDGGDVFYKWTSPTTGNLNVYACSSAFQASLTILGNGTDADGTPIVNDVLSCNDGFNGCSDPEINDPDRQPSFSVNKGQTLVFAVTGLEATDSGPFNLSLSVVKPGKEWANAIFLDGLTVSASGNSTEYDRSSLSPCNNATVTDDGPDVYYGFGISINGTLIAKACSSQFNATATIYKEATVEAGLPEPVACGTCANPAKLTGVTNGTFYYVVVSGQTASGFGTYDVYIKNLDTPTIGTSFAAPIDLGSNTSISVDGDTSLFSDTSLSDCHDDGDYPDFNATAGTNGDGGDVYYKWTAAFTGFATFYACSSEFQPSVTILGNGTDSDGTPIVNGNLACGGGFNSCQDPNIEDPTNLLTLQVTAGQTLIVHVTGTDAVDFGGFTLSIELQKPGASKAASIFLDSRRRVTVQGDNTGFDSSLVSICNNNTNGQSSEDDGPDMWYSFAPPVAGLLTARACGYPGATVTILQDATAEGGDLIPVGCGTCDKPAKAAVDPANFYYIVVSGNDTDSAGPFTLFMTNFEPPPVGGSFDKPIDLGNKASLVQNGNSVGHLDSSLAGCADPFSYGGENATSGDGGDVFYRWTAPFSGFLTAYACSGRFQASLTVLGNGTDSDGKPIVNGNLGCGGSFNGCFDPNIRNPDNQLYLAVTKGQKLILAVTGTEINDYGPFRLALGLQKAGSSLATAIFLDKPAPVINANTAGMPSSFKSPCNRLADGPDMYYSYSTDISGILTVKPCGTGFDATATILLDAATEGGQPTPVACGNCANPAKVYLKNGTYVYIVVSGRKSTDAGRFNLRVATLPALATPGSSMANAINLGSPSKLVRIGDTSRFNDTMLSGCTDPTDYNDTNLASDGTFGDGGDMFFKWTAPSDGFLTASACSNVFPASLTVIGNGVDAGGKPIVQGVLGCGSVVRSCSDPNLRNPDQLLLLKVKAGQVLTLLVTGTRRGDYGPFTLNLALSPPASSFATANYLGEAPSVTVNGTTTGYPATFVSSCIKKPDGPDVYYSYSMPINGTLTAKACGFTGATVSILQDATTEGGKPLSLACGTCAAPAVAKNVTADTFLYLVVTGSRPANAGAFNLTLSTST